MLRKKVGDMSMNWGECYFDHFARVFRNPVDREIFSQSDATPSIQILAYDGVFQDCRVFCSLGLSHYSQEISKVAEVFLPVDAGWEAVPRILANALFHAVQKRMVIGRGMVVGGIAAVDPDFAQEFNVAALYLTTPFGLPEDFGRVQCSGRTGLVYLAFFISPSEYSFFDENGIDKFEDLLEARNVDPYALRRKSFI